MAHKFNLNVFSYDVEELEELLSLEKPYSKDHLYQSCDNLRKKLFSDESQTNDDKAALNGFLKQVKIKLSKNCKEGAKFIIPNENLISPDVSVTNEYNKTEFIPTYPKEESAKNLNPIKKRLIRKTLNIDTRFRDNYYTTESTNIMIDLPTVIKNAINMRLVGFELPPCPIYTINKKYGNHFFHITINGGTTWHRVTIGDGNYQATEMIDEINNNITTNATLNGKVSADIHKPSCKIFFDFDAGLNSNDIGLAFNLDINGSKNNTNLQLKLGWILGFTIAEYKNSSGSSNYQFIGEAPYDGAGSKYLYLVVDDFNHNVNNYFVGAFNNSLLNQNILARLPQYSRNEGGNAQVADDINDLTTSERNYFGPIHIQKLKLQLLDEFGRIVSLNNRDYSIALEFNCIYN